MTSIAVLGTGAVGTAVASVLLDRGHPVSVWNRTPGRTARVAARGAAVVERLADVRAGLVLVCTTDGAAAAEVVAALPPGRCDVVTLLTTTPDDADRLAALTADRGLGYLAAGVQAGPEVIGGAGATFLVGGDAAILERHRVVLEQLGTVRWVGTTPRAAALWDQTLFGVWYDAQLGLLRALALVRDAGGDVTELAAAAARQVAAVVDGAGATAAEVVAGRAPRGPASLAEHLPLLRDLAATRAGTPTGDGGLADVAERVAALVDDGRGEDGLSALVQR